MVGPKPQHTLFSAPSSIAAREFTQHQTQLQHHNSLARAECGGRPAKGLHPLNLKMLILAANLPALKAKRKNTNGQAKQQAIPATCPHSNGGGIRNATESCLGPARRLTICTVSGMLQGSTNCSSVETARIVALLRSSCKWLCGLTLHPC